MSLHKSDNELKKYQVRFYPTDTLILRDGRPFEQGEDIRSGFQFPPSLTTLYGMLRSIIIYEGNAYSNPVVYSDDIIISSFNIESNAPYFNTNTHGLTSCFPLPLDLSLIDGRTSRLNLIDNFNSSSSLPKILMQSDIRKSEDLSDKFISNQELEKYLNSNEITNVIQKPFFKVEPKIGISRNRQTGSTVSGKLYTSPMLRLDSFCFCIEFSTAKPFPDKGYTRLGADGKQVYFEKTNENNPFNKVELPNDMSSQTIFKLYLATPAIFNEGSVPNKSKWNENITLVASVVGKPMHIGGFDRVSRKPKKMYRAVPAGSVYYFEVNEGKDMQDIIKSLHGTCISEVDAHLGYGLVYVGKM